VPVLSSVFDEISEHDLPGACSDLEGQINHDARGFIRYFLPKGVKADRGSIQKAIRHLHLAFKGMETEEIYDVLMEHLLAAAAKYDPHYTDKIKQVVGVIEHALSGIAEFFAADVDRHLQFNCHRHLRLLCRRGFLVSQPRKEQKRVVYRRTEDLAAISAIDFLHRPGYPR